MSRAIRFGLRAQIVAALLVVFVASFVLLGTAALRLTQTAAEVEHQRTTQAAREALTESLGDVHASRALIRAADQAFVSRAGESSARAYRPLANLLVFYVMLTGGAVVLLAYIALTHLIVRPLDRLTEGSEQLAAGSLDARVPEQGAAEVANLAATFNVMAEQLRRERTALEERLHELERTTRELRATQQQLIHGEKLASVGRLAAGLAHEIGNPLAAILGLVELMRAGDLSAEQNAEFLQRVHRETERIHGILRDLLDFARRDPEAATGESASLAEAVEDALSLLRPQKESKSIELHLRLDPSVDRVVGTRHRLTQVVLNLVLNALDALQGKGDVWIASAPDGDGGCVLTVSDNGPGIAEPMLNQLFEPFTTTKPPGKGTGLGLAVSSALVEDMGGRIDVSNRPEGGARFEVHLTRA